MSNLGTAYVSVMPSMKGFGAAIESGMSGIDTTSAGNKMGEKAASGFAGGMAKNGIVMGAASAMATKAFDAVASSADRAISRVDTMQNFPKVMNNLGISSDEASVAIGKISDGLDGLPTALDEGVAAVQRFTSFNGDVQKSTDMFLAVNDAILAGGASSQLQASALEQLSQAYTKGKMDTMEWRTLQQAMPAQLKQVADAMGMTTEQLGDGLRQAEKADNFIRNVSMDEFIGEIMKLDKDGGEGLASFKQQAQDATTGIGTAMANLNTRVAKGVATLIDAVGQENISGAINTLSSGIGSIANDLAGDLKAATAFVKEHENELSNLVSTLTEFAPTAIRAYGAFKVFKGGKAVFTEISGGATAAISKIEAIGTSATAMGGKLEAAGIKGAGALTNMGGIATDVATIFGGMSLGATGLVAGVGIAIGALYAYNLAMWEAAGAAAGLTAEEQALVDGIHSASTQYGELTTRRDEQIGVINAESDTVRNLKDEYNGLIDANGQVIAGNEERAGQIIGELASAMGVEEEEIYNLIDSYGQLGEAADDAILKMRGQKLLEANAESYADAAATINDAAQAVASSNELMDTAAARNAEHQQEYSERVQFAMDTLSGSAPEALSYAATSYGDLAYAADSSAAAVSDAAKAHADAMDLYISKASEIENYEGLSAALDSGDADRIEEWSARVQYGVESAANGTRESLQKQVDTFQSSYDSMAAAVEAGDSSMEDDLASLGIALNAARGELEKYDATQLHDKVAEANVDDGQLIIAQDHVYEWNGSELVDLGSVADVDESGLLKAQDDVLVWNGTTLSDKSAYVSVSGFDAINSIISAWENWTPSLKTAMVNTLRFGQDAQGGFFDLHASGGFITDGPISLGRDARGVTHIAGEDGREWVMRHADGTTSIVPIENKKYLTPYAATIAQMLGGTMGRATVVNLNLNYDASDDADALARGVANRLQVLLNTEG